MAYQTGASGSINDLVTALLAFAVANGYTAGSSWSASGLTVATVSKDGINFLFSYDSTNLSLNTATSVTGSGAANTQPGAASVSATIRPIEGPHLSYHFFTDGMTINAAVEIDTNVFTHINFGWIIKNGTWTGGAFVSGSASSSSTSTAALALRGGSVILPYHSLEYSNTSSITSGRPHIRSSIITPDGLCGLGCSFSGSSSTVFNKAWLTDRGYQLLLSSPNAYNGRAPLVPVTFIQATSGIEAPYYQLGHVTNAATINIATMEPKSIVNTDWMVFPIGQKGATGTAYIHSGNLAMAYKQ